MRQQFIHFLKQQTHFTDYTFSEANGLQFWVSNLIYYRPYSGEIASRTLEHMPW